MWCCNFSHRRDLEGFVRVELEVSSLVINRRLVRKEFVMAEQASISNLNRNSKLSNKRHGKGVNKSRGRISTNSGRITWRTESEHQIYSSNFVDALQNLRRSDSAALSGRAVRSAADKALAVSAKGKTRWSRAILASRLNWLAQTNRKHKKAAKPVAGSRPQPLQRKVKVLRRLVPGCRKVALPNLLEETGDYIAALEMQVRAMAFLMALLNGDVEASGQLSSAHSSCYSYP